MVFTPGFIWGKQGTAAYKMRVTGEGAEFLERKKTRVSCEEWRGGGGGGALTPSPHGYNTRESPSIYLQEDVGRGGPDKYVVSFMRLLNSAECQVDGLLAGLNIKGRLREHFMYCPWKDKVDIINEGPEPLPQCDHCGIHMAVARLM